MCTGGGRPPDPAPPQPLPQVAKAPDSAPLRRRNAQSGGFTMPAGSTALTGPSGIASTMLNIGSATLLGGGSAPG